MTKAKLTPDNSEVLKTTEYAGAIALASRDVLTSALRELTSLVRELDKHHPLRRRLDELRMALQNVHELNNGLIQGLSLAALHSKLAEALVPPAVRTAEVPLDLLVSGVLSLEEGSQSLGGGLSELPGSEIGGEEA